jgi:hypothetical protein
MNLLLFMMDALFGHVIEDSEGGPVYKEDGVRVDLDHLRPCAHCGARSELGSHDACIANLPSVRQACCGHGLDCLPGSDRPAGYVELEDGRVLEFSGRCGGTRIQEAVKAAVTGEPLPAGFCYGERVPWKGLSHAQREYVQRRALAELARVVHEVGGRELAEEGLLKPDEPWWVGLTKEQKSCVWAKMRAKVAELAEEARQEV